jgi:hypothetical protein
MRVLSYAAARWPQFDLGPMVLGQSYRNPAMLAKMGATLQRLNRGRCFERNTVFTQYFACIQVICKSHTIFFDFYHFPCYYPKALV